MHTATAMNTLKCFEIFYLRLELFLNLLTTTTTRYFPSIWIPQNEKYSIWKLKQIYAYTTDHSNGNHFIKDTEAEKTLNRIVKKIHFLDVWLEKNKTNVMSHVKCTIWILYVQKKKSIFPWIFFRFENTFDKKCLNCENVNFF